MNHHPDHVPQAARMLIDQQAEIERLRHRPDGLVELGPEHRYVTADGRETEFDLHNEGPCGCRRESRNVWAGPWLVSDGTAGTGATPGIADDGSGWTAEENEWWDANYGPAATSRLRAANNRVWAVVAELRAAAVTEGRDPYRDGMAQRLSGALVGVHVTGPATGAGPDVQT